MALTSTHGLAGALSQFETRRKTMERIADPFALRRSIAQLEQRRRLFDDPLGLRRQQKALENLVRPPALEKLTRQRQLLDELVATPPIFNSLAGFRGTAPFDLDAGVEDFRHEVTTAAEPEPLEDNAATVERLATEREAILTCLRRLRDSAIVAGLIDVPIPDVVLALVIAFVVLGEVADEMLRERNGDVAA